MLSFAPDMLSNTHTSINAFLGKSSSALPLHFKAESLSADSPKETLIPQAGD